MKRGRGLNERHTILDTSTHRESLPDYSDPKWHRCLPEASAFGWSCCDSKQLPLQDSAARRPVHFRAVLLVPQENQARYMSIGERV